MHRPSNLCSYHKTLGPSSLPKMYSTAALEHMRIWVLNWYLSPIVMEKAASIFFYCAVDYQKNQLGSNWRLIPTQEVQLSSLWLQPKLPSPEPQDNILRSISKWSCGGKEKQENHTMGRNPSTFVCLFDFYPARHRKQAHGGLQQIIKQHNPI